MNLLDKTKVLLSIAKPRMPLREIAAAAGNPVTYEWLRKFDDGTSKHPSVVRVQALHDYLERALTQQESAA
jgi:hypothetical protein